jgi:hypothetical protein
VRTRDWVAPWNAPGAPGKFQVLIDGTPLDTTFGIEGAEWHWQDGMRLAHARLSAMLSSQPGLVSPVEATHSGQRQLW